LFILTLATHRASRRHGRDVNIWTVTISV